MKAQTILWFVFAIHSYYPHLADVCGLAADAAESFFWVTSGTGDIVRVRASENGLTATARFHADAACDNHAIRI